MNRLSRDEVIHRGLSLADVASLDQHDRPNGVISEGAFSIGWLQDGLDLAHHLWPEGGLIKQFTFTLVEGVDKYALATDHVLDVKDGLVFTAVNPVGGTRRRGQALRWTRRLYTAHISKLPATTPPGTGYKSLPSRYFCESGVGGGPPNIYLFPPPDKEPFTATLDYYSLPNVLIDGAKIPTFPNDYVLVEYVHKRAKEWAHLAEPNAALMFLKDAVGALKSAGIGNEHEIQDEIPLDPRVFRHPGHFQDRWDWMGFTNV